MSAFRGLGRLPWYVLPWCVLWAAMAFVAGCGDTGPGGDAQSVGPLEPLPIPAHLGDVDPPVRAQYEERRAALDRALESGGEGASLAQAYGALGMWHQAYGDHELARLAYLHTLAQDPEGPQWHYYLGLVHGDLGETDAARQSLGRFLDERPGDTPAHVHLAEIELDAGQTVEARAHFMAALGTMPNTPRALAGLGRLELQERNFDAAVEHLERALHLQTGKAQVHYSLGLAYRGLGERERAADHMAKGSIDNRDKSDASMADPLLAEVLTLKQGARVHGQRGRRAFAAGDFERAVEEARRAVAANPEKPQPWLNLGAALLRADRAEEAIDALEESLRLSPGHPIVHFNLGATYYRLGRRADAEEQYLASVAANPGFKEAHFNLANLRRFRGDCHAALPGYGRVVELDPGLALARLWRVVCLVELGRAAEGRRTLESDLTQLGGATALQTLYIRLLANAEDSEARDVDQALNLAESFYRARPTLAAAEALAAVHARRGEFERAVAWQQAALDAVREQAKGEVLARLARRLETYRRGQPSPEVWADNELLGADLRVAPRPAELDHSS